MRRLQRLALLLTALPALHLQAQYTDEINSNRPGKSHGAFAVGASVLQAEGGFYYINEKHDLLETKASGVGFDFTFRAGLFREELELVADLQYQTDRQKSPIGDISRSALRQTVIGAKYLFYDPNKNYEEKPNLYSWKAQHRFKWRQFIPALAMFAGANLNFDNPYTFPADPGISPKLMLITQNQFSGGYVVVINVIADKVTTDFPSYGYILTITKGINEKWSAFFENQGYKSDFYADSVLRGGAAYLLRENMQLDASISGNLKNTPSIFYGGVGLSWRFDENYKPVLIRSGKEDGKKDKDKKGKDKKKKRKDEVEVPAP